MTNHLQEVLNWTNTFNHVVNETPTFPKLDNLNLRLRLLREEITELEEAYHKGDLVECADALADIQFVLDGTILSFGMQDKFEEMCSEVYRSNMSKLDADGKPIYRGDGKVIKSDLLHLQSFLNFYLTLGC